MCHVRRKPLHINTVLYNCKYYQCPLMPATAYKVSLVCPRPAADLYYVRQESKTSDSALIVFTIIVQYRSVNDRNRLFRADRLSEIRHPTLDYIGTRLAPVHNSWCHCLVLVWFRSLVDDRKWLHLPVVLYPTHIVGLLWQSVCYTKAIHNTMPEDYLT